MMKAHFPVGVDEDPSRRSGGIAVIDLNARATQRDADWLVRAILAGFAATVAMTGALVIAYGVALMLGSADPQASVVLRWLWALAHNTVTAGAETSVPITVLLHVVAGIGWAVVYAALAEPRLSGPGWRRGLTFAPIPWLLSLIVFLPLVGGGFLGLGLGAGPLPIIGNLLLHVVYGLTLGFLYAPENARVLHPDDLDVTPAEQSLLTRSEQTMATGMLLGLVAGAIVGWVIAFVFTPGQSGLVGMLLGALGGSAAGLLVGSYSGLTPTQQ
jgi:hypothetical protein